MKPETFASRFSPQLDLNREEQLLRTNKDLISNELERAITLETSPRIMSMLRFQVDEKHLSILKQRIAQNRQPLLTLLDLVELDRMQVIRCVNIDQMDNYFASWNGRPLTNLQAEQDLTTPRAQNEFTNLFTLVPISVHGKNSLQKSNHLQTQYLLLNASEDVLSPGEPTSTRMWLNALYKYYDFQDKKVAEVFAGTSPAATMAALGGASLIDSYELNPDAVQVAQKNYDFYQIQNGEAVQSDIFSAAGSKKYDYILANPPFNPKFKESGFLARLLEAVQDKSYSVLHNFLLELPNHLEKNGKAVILYEDFTLEDALSNGSQNAIKLLIENMNNDTQIPYRYTYHEKIYLRRFRGQANPMTRFVVVEIGIE